MPTKSNNIGGRGGTRPGAGRKKTALKDKIASGNPGVNCSISVKLATIAITKTSMHDQAFNISAIAYIIVWAFLGIGINHKILLSLIVKYVGRFFPLS